MNGRFVSYYRVSTDKQGAAGLGIEAQRAAVAAFLNGGTWTISGEFVEVESGTNAQRPELAKALALCKLTGATLVIAKLDRLSRNAMFLLSVVEGCGENGVVFCDLPSIPAGPVGKFIVTQMAAVAELEAGLISQRTKAALTAAKARGAKLGGWRGGPKVDTALGTQARQGHADDFAARVRPMVSEMQARGMSLRSIAADLTSRGVQTARGGAWTPAAVRNVMLRQAT